MRLHHFSGEIFADYCQFYLHDGGLNPPAPTDYTAADCEWRMKVGENVVVILPERNCMVPVEVEVHHSEPAFSEGEWDHIVEASLHLPTGGLQIHECTGGPLVDFVVLPGWYRVRSFHARLGTVDGLKGSDRYRVVVWPAAKRQMCVMKQYFAPNADSPGNG